MSISKVHVVRFANGLFAIRDGDSHDVEATEDQLDGDWKTALARGYTGIKIGQKAKLLEIWKNCYGEWAKIELDGRRFDVRPHGLHIDIYGPLTQRSN